MSAFPGNWQPLIETIGWTLLHFLWQATIIGAGYGVVRALLPVRRCDARYAAGLVALALMAIAPVVTFVEMAPDPVASMGTALATGMPTTTGTPITTGPSMAAAADLVVSGTIGALDPFLPWVVLLWGCGVAMMFSRAARQWRALQLVVTLRAVPDATLERMLLALSNRFGVARRIRVLVSEHIDTPTLIGWLKPVILVPASVVLGFPVNQLELILAHELGHMRRYDHLVNLGQALLETLLFYHPVVHWVSREVRNEREICCDALVLRLTEGEPREYARTLAALEEIRQVPSQLALAATGGLLVDRVRRIVGMPAIVQVDRDAGARLRIGTVAVVMAICLLQRVGSGNVIELDAPRLAIAGAQAISAGALIDRAAFVALERHHIPRVAAKLVDDATSPVAPASVAVAATLHHDESPQQSSVAPALAPSVVDRSVVAVPPSTVDIRGATLAVGVARVAPPPLAVTPVAQSATPVVVELARHVPPVPLRRVAPQYPSESHHKQNETVDLEFQIEADGSVGKVDVISGAAEGPFEKAAERALRQWRFDPGSVARDAGARFSQSFVFTHPGAERKSDDGDCVTPTGSHICRRASDGGGTVMELPAGGHTLQVAGRGASVGG